MENVAKGGKMRIGNGFYSVEGGPNFNLASVDLSTSRDIYGDSYILNPERKKIVSGHWFQPVINLGSEQI